MSLKVAPIDNNASCILYLRRRQCALGAAAAELIHLFVKIGPEPGNHFSVSSVRVTAVDPRLVPVASGLRHARQPLGRESLQSRSRHRAQQLDDVCAGGCATQHLTYTLVPACADSQSLQRRERVGSSATEVKG